MQIVAEKSRCVKKKKVKTQSSPDIVMEGLTYREARGWNVWKVVEHINPPGAGHRSDERRRTTWDEIPKTRFKTRQPAFMFHTCVTD